MKEVQLMLFENALLPQEPAGDVTELVQCGKG